MVVDFQCLFFPKHELVFVQILCSEVHTVYSIHHSYIKLAKSYTVKIISYQPDTYYNASYTVTPIVIIVIYISHFC